MSKPLVVLKSQKAAMWRRQHNLDWVALTVHKISKVLGQHQIPHLWVGDVAMQELGLEFPPSRLDLLSPVSERAIWALLGTDIYRQPNWGARPNALYVPPWGTAVWVWGSESRAKDLRHIHITNRLTEAPRIANSREALAEQRVLARLFPTAEMESRVEALEGLRALRKQSLKV